MRKILTSLGLGLFIFAFSTAPALAAGSSVNVNFENPPYTTGTINSQDGWSSTGAAGSGCAVYDHKVSSSLGTAGFGSQSLRISNAAVSGCFGDQTFAKPLTNAVGEVNSTDGSFSRGTLQRHFATQFDIASTQPSALQEGLYTSVSPDRGDGSRMSYLRFEDQSNGVHVFFDDVTDPSHVTNADTFNETDIATLNRAVPHTIKLTLDTLDGPDNDVVNVWIDGNLVKTGTSWEDYYRYDSEASAEQSPRIVKTVLFRTGGGPSDARPGLVGKGFLFDNLSLSSGAIPPTDKDQCKKDGWKQFNDPSFKNQGQCIDFVEHNRNDTDHHDNEGDHGHHGDDSHHSERH